MFVDKSIATNYDIEATETLTDSTKRKKRTADQTRELHAKIEKFYLEKHPEKAIALLCNCEESTVSAHILKQVRTKKFPVIESSYELVSVGTTVSKIYEVMGFGVIENKDAVVKVEQNGNSITITLINKTDLTLNTEV